MTRLIDPSLRRLSFTLSEMGTLDTKIMSLATESFITGTNTSNEALRISDMIRQKYFEVGNLTFEILLKYQPVAQDFRFTRSSIEISYDFLRFGRYAYDITMIRDSFGDLRKCVRTHLNDSLTLVERMVKDAILSFATLNLDKARHIQDQEAMVDSIYHERMLSLIKSNDTKCAMAEALLLRYLERIADHALFMSDSVNYIITGEYRNRPQKRKVRDLADS
ncbi:MAG: phosphate uptake regulator PhoU [Cenarchaeum sp. SB0678_bin_8]|nr:phosphate uptake regulator PhoU [Cenarchaeum sp. SB0666_bin_15]MYD58125.1 phosphate uptake regulator PhoU [Cenarchaeum sp. SB0678_bin_8]MYJ27615.1 phosphate uptake regulator PhoU [Cenarchaeum sp. SB0672_bin_9]